MSPADKEPTYSDFFIPPIDLEEDYEDDPTDMSNEEIVHFLMGQWSHPSKRDADIVELILETTTPKHDDDTPHQAEVKNRFYALTTGLRPADDTNLFTHDLEALLAQTGPDTPQRHAVEAVLKAHLFESTYDNTTVSPKLLPIYDRLCRQIITD